MTARITRETQRLVTNPVEGVISCAPTEANFRHFVIKMQGPPDSPYVGGIFNLEMLLPEDYPMSPPKVLFRNKIYHPNIDKLGRICLSILKIDGIAPWSPALMIHTVLLSIQALMSAPNLDDPLDASVADHWRADEDGAIQKARDWTKLYAK